MPSQTPFTITIVGGGIAGLCTAIALRAPDRQIIILEQSRLHTEIGATISLQPNASKILEQTWGLGPYLEEAQGMADRGFRVFDSEGSLVREIPLADGEAGKRYGAERMMYHRQDLHQALKKAATAEFPDDPSRGPPATIRTLAKAVCCDCMTGIVTLADGSTVGSDLIVAADGIHSALRPSILGHNNVHPKPTGLSAYRMVLPISSLQSRAPDFCSRIDPAAPYTSMMLAHSTRLIMSPARSGSIFGIVGLVPDERMDEDPDAAQSWHAKGDPEKMAHTFRDFPDWARAAWTGVRDIGLWQLRDIDPLPTWTKGRAILIGDAAHAMLPTQGQGASQSVEDAEALGAFFAGIGGTPELADIEGVLARTESARYERATLIQRYSRESSKPATEKVDSRVVKMQPDEFMEYNVRYEGAVSWEAQQAKVQNGFRNGVIHGLRDSQ